MELHIALETSIQPGVALRFRYPEGKETVQNCNATTGLGYDLPDQGLALISLCLVCCVCGIRLKNSSMRNSGLNYCNMFKSFFILIWELFAEDSFSKGLE